MPIAARRLKLAWSRAVFLAASAAFEWHFDALPSNFEDPLWPIARSASDLLASDQLAYVRMCASRNCEWFFLDTSKNHRRREKKWLHADHLSKLLDNREDKKRIHSVMQKPKERRLPSNDWFEDAGRRAGGAFGEMLVAQMVVNAAAPTANKGIVERAANRRTGQGNDAPNPLFRTFFADADS